jgi:hypothetical protein
MRRMDSAEIRFLNAVSRYRTKDHKRNEDTRADLGVTDICTVIKKAIKTNGYSTCKERFSCMNQRAEDAMDIYEKMKGTVLIPITGTG